MIPAFIITTSSGSALLVSCRQARLIPATPKWHLFFLPRARTGAHCTQRARCSVVQKCHENVGPRRAAALACPDLHGAESMRDCAGLSQRGTRRGCELHLVS